MASLSQWASIKQNEQSVDKGCNPALRTARCYIDWNKIFRTAISLAVFKLNERRRLIKSGEPVQAKQVKTRPSR